MLQKLKQHKHHIKTTGWYLGSSLMVAFISVAINPLLAKNLSPDDYAVIGYYSAFNLLFTPFITFYLSNFFIQRYFKSDENQRARLKSTILYMLLGFSLLLSFISLVALYIYQTIFNSGSEIAFFPYALLTIFAVQFSGIYSLTLAELRIKREPKKFALFTVTSGVLLTSMSLLLVVVIKGGAEGRFGATLIANLVMFAVVMVFQRDSFKPGFDKGIFRDTISFCWPLVIAGCLGFFSAGFDKIALERLDNLAELGYYSVGVQMAGYLSFFSTSINSTFQPDIYENYATKNYRRVALFTGLIIGSITLVVLMFILCAPFIVNILTAGRYVYSTSYAIIVSLSTITAAIYYSSSNITMAMGYTKLLMVVKIIGSALTISLYSYMIDMWRYEGAAWGNVLSYMVFFAVNFIFVYLYIKFKKRKANGVSVDS